ncbi:MAG: class I SAM-dependent methyltransferase [Cyanobacteria bacterium P01_H01_bin.119]
MNDLSSALTQAQPRHGSNLPINVPQPVTPLGILSQLLERLSAKAKHLSLEPDFLLDLQRATELAVGLEPYIGTCTTSESSALSALTQRTQAEDWSQRFLSGETVHPLEQEMLSGHVEGQFLKLLLHAIGARRVLEIGMFTGYSALAMAEALPDNGVLVACELDRYSAEFAQTCFANSPHGHKIQVKIGSALESLSQLAAEQLRFDFVFIDANKDGYIDYFNAVLGSLLAPNGLICVDNTLMQGEVYRSQRQSSRGKAIAEFNQTVADDPRVEQVLLPLRDGVTLIRRR